jgi:hypothetical protein
MGADIVLGLGAWVQTPHLAAGAGGALLVPLLGVLAAAAVR